LKSVRLSLGSRLDARFQPSQFWGAEFLANRVRLGCFELKAQKPVLLHTFEGTYPEAEAFAVKYKIRLLGLHAAVSHLPFKVHPLGSGSEAGDQDITPVADRLRPQGLPLTAFDMQTLLQGNERHIVLAREDSLRGVLEAIPTSLSSLETLDAAPLALLSSFDLSQARGGRVALMLEADYCHLVLIQDGILKAYAKVFSGWEEAQAQPEIFEKEINKSLVYHFNSRFPDIELSTIEVWKDGPKGELALTLKSLGLAQCLPNWHPLLVNVPEAFRVAAVMAMRGFSEDVNAFSFSIPLPREVYQRRVWQRRTGTLVKTGSLILMGSAFGVALLVMAALALRWTVVSKAKTWSGELSKWDEYQKRKVSVETQFGEMRDMLSHRTLGYSSIQNISACLPPEVWLDSWEMESEPGHGLVHRLAGFSLTEARIPEFLSNLEKVKNLGTVKLKSTERVKGESVEQKTSIQANRKDLVRYQIGISE
jgi:hypothetical protein